MALARQACLFTQSPQRAFSSNEPENGGEKVKVEIGVKGFIEMESIEEWEAYLDAEIPVIIQASATWCGPCK